jgi:protein LSM14
MSLANNSSIKKPSATGTTDSPYLGSKISLVSKAKIRYEGILYTIDANESTVALSKVRSFGTEDRPTDRPVPARDEIFEYIIFRGADIEDLQVREPPQSTLTQDPAIVESSMYPANARSTTIGTNNNLGGNQTRSSSNQGTMPSPPVQQGLGKGLKSSSNTDPLRQLNLNQQQSSRPFSQQSTSAQLEGQDYSHGNQRRGRQQQDYYNDYNNNNNRRGNQKYDYSEWPRTNNAGWDNGYRQQQPQRYPRQQQQQQQQQQNYEGNRFYPSKRPNNGQQAYGYYGYRERRNSTGGITGNQQTQPRNNRQQRERTDSIRGNSNNRSTLKFIGDFDFEKSNAEFDKNAIEDEIKKSLSIKTNKDKTDDISNTDSDKEKEKENDQQKQQQQQQPTNSSTPQLEQQDQETNPDGYYDKQKSFFDRISCETTEKEKTNSRRNWNEERRVNAETFGLKYRPIQQTGNQRNGQGGYYNNNNRRNYNGQQSYYGNGARYQRGGGGGGGNYGDDQQRSRNTTYYNNTNKRMQAY